MNAVQQSEGIKNCDFHVYKIQRWARPLAVVANLAVHESVLHLT